MRTKISVYTCVATLIALFAFQAISSDCAFDKDVAYAKEQYRMIACFSTYYGDSKQNRKDNVALACRKIDGTVLYPEDEFSFNFCHIGLLLSRFEDTNTNDADTAGYG